MRERLFLFEKSAGQAFELLRGRAEDLCLFGYGDGDEDGGFMRMIAAGNGTMPSECIVPVG